MKIRFFSFVLGGFLLAAPFTSSAYHVLDTAAVKLNDSLALYRITLHLGSETYAFKTPVQAALHNEAEADETAVAFYDADRQQADLSATPFTMVFADNATIEDGHYHIARGEAAEVSVIGLVPLVGDELDGHAMRITDLPLELTRADGEVYENAVKASEFKTYVTESLTAPVQLRIGK